MSSVPHLYQFAVIPSSLFSAAVVFSLRHTDETSVASNFILLLFCTVFQPEVCHLCFKGFSISYHYGRAACEFKFSEVRFNDVMDRVTIDNCYEIVPLY